jgi:ATP-dependent Clp protease ATP-binding subunit ClpB
MTSNIGSQYIQEWDGKNFSELENRLQQELSHNFRPEFINRIDDIVIFDRIDKNDIQHIIEMQLAAFLEEVEKSKNIKLEFSDNAKKALADEGYDPAFGARPLKRVIQKRILNELAKKIIDGSIQADSLVKVDYAKGSFSFTVK